ncbi:nuclear transport factor 2 family protein [Nocardiopsis coralliicola]
METTAPRTADPAPHQAAERTRAYLAALEGGDAAALARMTGDGAVLTIPLSFDGAPEPAARFTGAAEVLGYLDTVLQNMERIRFTDVRVTASADGATAFVQARGDFTAAGGAPYRNVYVLRVDWDGDRVAAVEEYANPVAFTAAFGPPQG